MGRAADLRRTPIAAHVSIGGDHVHPFPRVLQWRSPAWCRCLVGTATVTTRGPHDYDTTNEEWGLSTGHQRGPPPGHQWGLFHGHGQAAHPNASANSSRSFDPWELRFHSPSIRPAVSGRSWDLGASPLANPNVNASGGPPDAVASVSTVSPEWAPGVPESVPCAKRGVAPRSQPIIVGTQRPGGRAAGDTPGTQTPMSGCAAPEALLIKLEADSAEANPSCTRTPVDSFRCQGALPAHPRLSRPVRSACSRWQSHGITPIGWQSGCQGADQLRGCRGGRPCVASRQLAGPGAISVLTRAYVYAAGRVVSALVERAICTGPDLSRRADGALAFAEAAGLSGS